jgi:hypothetical protein
MAQSTKPYTFAFSYSRWATWSKCPKSYKLQHVDKIDTGPTPKPLLEGRKVHDDIAHYIEAKEKEMPDRLKKNFSLLGDKLMWMHREMQKGIVQVEKQMSFDVAQKPVSWFSKESWTRFIWDVLVVDAAKIPQVTKAAAVDWKTGRPYASYDDQMQIFALPAFWTYPNLQEFTGHLLFLDTGDDKEFTITREQFYAHVERTWLGNIRMMQADVSYPATPSKDSCKFCDFGKKNLNICEDWYG